MEAIKQAHIDRSQTRTLCQAARIACVGLTAIGFGVMLKRAISGSPLSQSTWWGPFTACTPVLMVFVFSATNRRIEGANDSFWNTFTREMQTPLEDVNEVSGLEAERFRLAPLAIFRKHTIDRQTDEQCEEPKQYLAQKYSMPLLSTEDINFLYREKGDEVWMNSWLTLETKKAILESVGWRTAKESTYCRSPQHVWRLYTILKSIRQDDGSFPKWFSQLAREKSFKVRFESLTPQIAAFKTASSQNLNKIHPVDGLALSRMEDVHIQDIVDELHEGEIISS